MKFVLFFATMLFFSVAFSQTPSLNWAIHTENSTSSEQGTCIVIDASQNSYVVGDFSGTADFNPGAPTTTISSTSGSSLFFAKYTASGTLNWVKNLISTTSSIFAENIALDNSGNIYITGLFYGTVDFDPSGATANLSTSLSGDIYIAKYDNNGNYIWAKKITGAGNKFVQDIKVSSSGNIYITGSFDASTDFDPSATAYSVTPVANADIFVAKYNNNGLFVWVKQMGGTLDERGMNLSITSTESIYITGYFSGTVDFDPSASTSTLTSLGNIDAFITQLDANGIFILAKQIGGSLADEINDLKLDASNNVYLAGAFQGTCDFDPSVANNNLISSGGGDGFIGKYDPNLNLIWVKQFTGSGSQNVQSIDLDINNHIYIGGILSGINSDLDPSSNNYYLNSNGSSDQFIARYDNNGNILWAFSVGSTQQDVIREIAVGNGSNVFATGYFNGTVDFDPTLSSTNLASSNDDFFISKYNALCPVPATPSFIFGTAQPCSNASNTYSINAVPTATAYNWSLPSAWLGSSTDTSIITTSASGSGFVSVTSSNACGTSMPQQLSINVKEVPTISSTIFGSDTVCVNTSAVFSVSPVTNANTFYWTFPAGWTGSSTTNSISLNANSNDGILAVYASNNCGLSNTVAINLVGLDVPVSPISISGPTLMCSGSSSSYSCNTVADATLYNWMLPALWQGNSTGNTINITFSGAASTLSVNAVNICGVSTSQSLLIQIDSLPSAPSLIFGSNEVCENTSYTYSINPIAQANSYNWSFPPQWTSSSGTFSVIGVAGASGDITVFSTNHCGNSNPVNLSVTVNLNPSVSATSSNSLLCVGETSTLTASGATTYTWSNGNNSSAIVVSPTVTTTYTVVGMDNNGCLNTNIITQVVDLCTQILSISNNKPISIFPNPFKNIITILSSDSQPSVVEIFNFLGSKILEEKALQLTELNLSEYPNGVYFIKIQNVCYKLIKQN